MSFGDLPTLRWALSEMTAARRFGLRSSASICRIPAADDCSNRDVGYVTGAALMVRREVWERLGGLDEDYFLYFEETDFCARIHRASGRVVLVPKAKIIHLEGMSFAGHDLNRQLRFYQGMMLYFAKNLGWLATSVLGGAILVENAIYVVVGTLFGRLAPNVRENNPTHKALIRLVVRPGMTRRAGRTL